MTVPSHNTSFITRNARVYTCDACRNQFKSRLTPKAIVAEFKRNFPGETREEPGAICDDCWKTFRLGLSN